MILADSAVWIHHLREADGHLAAALDADTIAMHPFVLGELALGSFAERRRFLTGLADLQPLRIAQVESVRALIENEKLHGRGIGYVDAHLLASVLMTPGTRLWTRDKRLDRQARRLGVAFSP
jgi:predicted nucleic acid-binding protein